jgi:hypothetical protein
MAEAMCALLSHGLSPALPPTISPLIGCKPSITPSSAPLARLFTSPTPLSDSQSFCDDRVTVLEGREEEKEEEGEMDIEGQFEGRDASRGRAVNDCQKVAAEGSDRAEDAGEGGEGGREEEERGGRREGVVLGINSGDGSPLDLTSETGSTQDKSAHTSTTSPLPHSDHTHDRNETNENCSENEMNVQVDVRNVSTDSAGKKRPREGERERGGEREGEESGGGRSSPTHLSAPQSSLSGPPPASAITPQTLPFCLSSFIPTTRHFHAEVESTFQCLNCGFVREPKRVSVFFTEYPSNLIVRIFFMCLIFSYFKVYYSKTLFSVFCFLSFVFCASIFTIACL